MESTRREQERVILVGVSSRTGTDPETDIEESMDELAGLAEAAGAIVAGRVVQRREQVHPVTYIGKGKLSELLALLGETGADGILCDDELSPVQQRSLERELSVKIMDRTMVILDIFASRAVTAEGKIQVELAQLKYRLLRLAGSGTSLSRLGGGIGTRGPGEKKLETDRRTIRKKVAKLSQELDQVKRHREVIRSRRRKNGVPVAAVVGYTNAGKSTLLNALTGADQKEMDQLFATLDPAIRMLELPGKQQILLTDTVGFIRKLPHQLIEAFHSTLEEAANADLLLHVVDASSPSVDTQMHVVYETLRELGAMDKPLLTLFNKQDKVGEKQILRDFQAGGTIPVSAKTGQGLMEVKRAIGDILKGDRRLVEKVYSYGEAGKIQDIRKYGQLLEEEYLEDGIRVRAYVPPERL